MLRHSTVRSFSTARTLGGKLLQSYTKAPPPTEAVPDVETFLKKIGRNSMEYAKVFESWEDLMTKPSKELKENGIDNTRDRRYILEWRERFRQGIPLQEIKRGTKQWGGERRAKELKAQHYGRLRAENKRK